MRKLLLTLTITATLATASFGQKYVINKIQSDSINQHDLTLLRTAEDIYKSAIKKLNQQVFNLEAADDTVYNQQLWVAYANALGKVNESLLNQYLVNDTILVFEKNGNYYLGNDTLSFSIQDSQTELKRRYNRLVSKFGADKVNESRQGEALKNEYKLLVRYLNQLKEQ